MAMDDSRKLVTDKAVHCKRAPSETQETGVTVYTQDGSTTRTAHHCEQARKLLLKENNPNHAVLLEHYEQLHEQCLHKAELLASGIDPEAMAAPAEPQDTPAARPPETPPPAAPEPAAESSPKKKISLGAKRHDYD